MSLPAFPRVEFEASLESEEKVPSVIDEEEWASRNFGKSDESKDAKDSSVAGGGGGGEGEDKDNKAGSGDTSEDSVSDLDTDSDEEEDEDGPESRPLTADEARQLREEWMKKYAPAGARREDLSDDDDEEEDSDYENAGRSRRKR